MTDSSNQFDDIEQADMNSTPVDETSDDNEYEEICSDEVDRIVQALEELMAGVESENVRAYLEEAADNIFALVYEDEETEALEADSDADGLQDDLAA